MGVAFWWGMSKPRRLQGKKLLVARIGALSITFSAAALFPGCNLMPPDCSATPSQCYEVDLSASPDLEKAQDLAKKDPGDGSNVD